MMNVVFISSHIGLSYETQMKIQVKLSTLTCMGKMGGANMDHIIMATTIYYLAKSLYILEKQVSLYRIITIVTNVNYGWKHCGKE